MADIRDLYQEVILDHGRKPRNFRSMDEATNKADGFNPLCGDKVTLFMKVDEGRIADISFLGSGCAISTASASLLTTILKGKTVAEAESLFKVFHSLVTGQSNGNGDRIDPGKLIVFSGVSEFPSRVKCATLSWHTMHSALMDRNEPVTTE